MGTYTTNYNLFMPSVGEQGWGDLVNGNFTTIDTTIKGLDTRTTALESADTAFDARLQPLEAGEFDNIVANSITANELYAKRVGVPTTTKPNSWSIGNGFQNISYVQTINTSAASGSRIIDINTSMFSGYDELDTSVTIPYTISINDYASWVYISRCVIHFTDRLTNEATSQTFTFTKAWNTVTANGPGLADVSITTYMNQTVSGGNSATITVSRPTVYFKTKGI